MAERKVAMPTQPAKTGPAPVTAAGPGVMRAIVQDVYGSADRMRLAETERPVPAAGEVVVEVRAAGVDRGTCHLMRGEPYLIRILGFGFRGPKNRIPGLDVAGTVVAAGAGVTRFQAGDDVFGIARGSFADYTAAREDKLVRKPAALSFERAAVVAVSGLAALQGLRAGHIATGQKVLIIGASGGVGTYAVQLAKALGAKVTAVCSTGKADLVRSLGADEVIDYTRADFADGRQHYDLILDIGGNSRLSRLRRALTPTGTLVIAGGEGAKWTGVGRQLRALMLSPVVRQRLTMYISRHRQADLEELRLTKSPPAAARSLRRTSAARRISLRRTSGADINSAIKGTSPRPWPTSNSPRSLTLTPLRPSRPSARSTDRMATCRAHPPVSSMRSSSIPTTSALMWGEATFTRFGMNLTLRSRISTAPSRSVRNSHSPISTVVFCSA